MLEETTIIFIPTILGTGLGLSHIHRNRNLFYAKTMGFIRWVFLDANSDTDEQYNWLKQELLRNIPTYLTE